jgi:hypothetical protein
MFDVAESLRNGLAVAAERLRNAQDMVARTNAGDEGRSTGAAMAQTAQAAIFEEALLTSVKARLSEIKSVTR